MHLTIFNDFNIYKKQKELQLQNLAIYTKHTYSYTNSVNDYRLHWQMDFNTSFLEFDKVEHLQEHVMKQAYQNADSITFSTSITEGILYYYATTNTHEKKKKKRKVMLILHYHSCKA